MSIKTEKMKAVYKAEEIFRLFLKYRHVCTDTRNIIPQSIFFALKGENFDANTFAAQALEKGCSYAVVDNPKYAGENCLLVENSLDTLRKIAVMYRKSLMIPVIGITGTNGKTTTKELVRSVLSVRFKTYATQGNLNNHIGVPLSLLSIPSDAETAIIEMGANHPGEIAGLCRIALPTYGIITNVGKAHLEGFGTFENILNTKTALYEFLRKVDGKAFVSRNNTLLMKASENMERYCYGTASDNFLQMTQIENRQNCLSCCLHSSATSLGNVEIHTHLVGNYNLENVAAAACAGRYFGLNNQEIREGIENYRPSNLRSQSIKTGSNTLIADTYNANPTSMQAALDNFASLQVSEKKMVILGDMLELGKASAEEHQNIVDKIAATGIPQAILVGNCFAKTKYPKHFQCFSDVDQLIEFLRKNPLYNSCLLIKGSHGIHLEKAVAFLQETH